MERLERCRKAVAGSDTLIIVIIILVFMAILFVIAQKILKGLT